MKELSIFIDESGDFGEYDHHSPYYIITMVWNLFLYIIGSKNKLPIIRFTAQKCAFYPKLLRNSG